MAHQSATPSKPISKTPLVTIIMPIRNEAHYIERSLGSVLAQDYPHDQMEVLVVDGMSDDDTREAVRRIANRTPDVPLHLLNNPARIVSPALNIGLRHARGAIIIRVDGHCEITSDYVRRCIVALYETGADCVGGTLVTVGETAGARAIANAQSSLFGVGGVAFRTGRDQPGYVDTLAFGAYRREVFDRIGDFDEELVRNQDDEFNFRLNQAGGRIWLDPSIQSRYYSRASLGNLWRQYYEYGFYKVRVIQKRGAVASWRHLVPALFVLSLIASLLLTLITGKRRWALGVVGPYVVASGLASAQTGRQNWSALPYLPVSFLILHLAYGSGFLVGLIRWRGGAAKHSR